MVVEDNSIVDFVHKQLSVKSMDYIQKKLFANDKVIEKILAENPRSRDKDMNFIIGQLETPELEFFIIRQSLSKRIAGIESRMEEDEKVSIHATNTEIKDARSLHEKRSDRLFTLNDDYKEVNRHLNNLIQNRLSEKIKSVLKNNPRLGEKIYDPPFCDSGFGFKIVDENAIMLIHQYVIGGD